MRLLQLETSSCCSADLANQQLSLPFSSFNQAFTADRVNKINIIRAHGDNNYCWVILSLSDGWDWLFFFSQPPGGQGDV